MNREEVVMVPVTQQQWEALVTEPGHGGSHILLAWEAFKRLRAGSTRDEHAEADSIAWILYDYARLRTTPPDAQGREQALRQAVEIAAIVFEEYARLHRKKATAEGEAKAKRNDGYAAEMRAALGAKPHPYGRPILDMLKDGNGGGERGEDD